MDEFHKELDDLLFAVPADLFIPAGGRRRPSTRRTGPASSAPTGGRPPRSSSRANSFITPEARLRLQEAGAVVLRDASANKCGVISSSYEIIGNLLLSAEEFTQHKEEYVRDVLEILERRSADEALILRRHREEGGRRAFTEISDALSLEINANKARLFAFFQSRPDLADRPLYRKALLAHLPRIIRETPAWRDRVGKLPPKYRSAILAAEIGAAMVTAGRSSRTSARRSSSTWRRRFK